MNLNALCKALAILLMGDELPDPSYTGATVWHRHTVSRFEIDPEPHHKSVAVRMWIGHARVIRYYDISTPA